MMTASAYGRLVTVKSVPTKTGRAMTTGTLAVSLPLAQTEEVETQWINLMAFNETAEELSKTEPGKPISVVGRLQFSKYTKGNEEKMVLQMLVDDLVTARTARPKGGKKKQPDLFAV